MPDKLHTATFEVKAVRAGALDLTRQDAAAGNCRGDAGGPLLRETAVETRLDDLRDWSAQTRPDALQGSVRFGRVTGIAGKCLDIKDGNTANGTDV